MALAYFAVFLGLFVSDWKRLSGQTKEKILYLCLMVCAAAAGVALWLAPPHFGIVG